MKNPEGTSDETAVGKTVFGHCAADYAKYRLSYPPSLFEYLASLCPSKEIVLDCATGNGQAAICLAKHFRTVEATDINPAQLAQCYPASNVRYSVSSAEVTSFPSYHFDLVTVASAAHWFDLPKFYDEIRRILKPEGALAIWGYSAFDAVFPSDIQNALEEEIYSKLEPYWSPRVKLLTQNYRALAFPFSLIESPSFFVGATFELEDWLGLISTWSALHVYEKANSPGLLDNARNVLASAWKHSLDLELPLHIKIGRK